MIVKMFIHCISDVLIPVNSPNWGNLTVICEWGNCVCTPLPPLAQIKFLGSFVWYFLDWSQARISVLGWKDGLAVKSTHYSRRGLGFNSQHLSGGVQFPILNSSSRKLLLLLASMGTRHAYVVHLHIFSKQHRIRFSMAIISWSLSHQQWVLPSSWTGSQYNERKFRE